MSSPALPMNRKQRREQKAGPQTHENTPLMVAFIRREIKKFPDGSEVAVCYFAPVTANGRPLLEDETPDGVMPVLLASVPVVVKRPSAILTGTGLVRS